VHLLACIDHTCRTVLAQRQVGGTPEEVPAFQQLLDGVDLVGDAGGKPAPQRSEPRIVRRQWPHTDGHGELWRPRELDTLQVLTATGNTTSTCTNQGGNQAPGQNPAPVTLVGATPVPAGDIKNGNVTITTTTDEPVTPVPGAPGCPNTNWREDITDVSFTSATIRLFQDQTAADGAFGRWETLVITVNCTFSPATSDGPVPSSGFTCTVA
jgi:hypothetical protein